MTTRGEKVCQFIERYCLIPEGSKVGQPIKLLDFQRKFVLDVYDNPAGTSRAYLSVARKNGKSALIAAIVLAHLVGPVAKQNSQIISGAWSRDQAGLVFKLAEKMVRLSDDLTKIVRIVPSQKSLVGLPCNVEYKAISAEAGETGAPTLGSPDIDIEHILGADDCEASAPVCEAAVIDVTRDLTADNILAGQPSVPDIPYGAAFLRYVQIEAISSNQVEITSYNQAV